MMKSLFNKYKEVILYIFFGGVTTLLNIGVYAVLVNSQLFSNNISNIIGWLAAVIVAYITNKIWVFESKVWSGAVLVKELGSFFGSRIATGVFEIGLFPLLVSLGLNQSIFGIDCLLAKIVVTVFVVILNYIFSKLFVFKKKQEHKMHGS